MIPKKQKSAVIPTYNDGDLDERIHANMPNTSYGMGKYRNPFNIKGDNDPAKLEKLRVRFLENVEVNDGSSKTLKQSGVTKDYDQLPDAELNDKYENEVKKVNWMKFLLDHNDLSFFFYTRGRKGTIYFSQLTRNEQNDLLRVLNQKLDEYSEQTGYLFQMNGHAFKITIKQQKYYNLDVPGFIDQAMPTYDFWTLEHKGRGVFTYKIKKEGYELNYEK